MRERVLLVHVGAPASTRPMAVLSEAPLMRLLPLQQAGRKVREREASKHFNQPTHLHRCRRHGGLRCSDFPPHP